jgi:hypothetical protein
MQRITLGRTGIETSCLGFGGASLGSRVGAAEGLRALEAAFERGVTWLDLAPAYGQGAAETIAADFLKGRRDRVEVATKVGLMPPRSAGGGADGGAGGLAGALMPLARRAIAALPGLRAALRRSGAVTNRKLPLTGALVRESLEASLRRLGTDRVELYALHNATPEEVAREDVQRALEGILAAGLARAVGVASDAAAARAALARSTPFAVAQFAVPPPGETGLVADLAAGGFGTVLHSVFGVEGALGRARARLRADPALARAVAEAAGPSDSDPEAALARLLLARALALATAGPVLVSMLSARSREATLAAAAAPPAAPPALLDRLLAA